MAASLRSMAAPSFSLGLWRARSGSGPMVVLDPLKAPDEVSNRRVECLDDPFGRSYGSKAYDDTQECAIHHIDFSHNAAPDVTKLLPRVRMGLVCLTVTSVKPRLSERR